MRVKVIAEEQHTKKYNFAISAPTIPSAAKLNITMSLEKHSKRRSKYQPIERPDGVIVLQRPYQPLTSPPQQQPTFIKHLHTFAAPCPSSQRVGAQPRIGARGLVHIGSQFTECGRGGYNTPFDAGRGGYNGVFDEHEEDAVVGSEEMLGSKQLSPMERYLTGVEPWSPWSVKHS
jgi:hypothetical protein